MNRPKGFLGSLIDPFLVTATILLIFNHWANFEIGDFVLLVIMLIAFVYRLRWRHRLRN